jgi:hypothetical protein
MRVRNIALPSTVAQTGNFDGFVQRYKGNPDGIPQHYDAYPVTTGTASKTMEDVVIGNYAARSAQGEIFNNPMESVHVSVMDAVVNWAFAGWEDLPPSYGEDAYSAVSGSNATSQMINLGFAFPEVSDDTILGAIEDVKQLAVTQAWSRVDASEAAALASLGELRKTVTSIGSIYMRAIDILMAVKKKDLKYLKGQISAGELTDRYMEARYAIRPLVYDAHQVLAALNKKVQIQRYTARGRAEKIFFSRTYHDT